MRNYWFYRSIMYRGHRTKAISLLLLYIRNSLIVHRFFLSYFYKEKTDSHQENSVLKSEFWVFVLTPSVLYLTISDLININLLLTKRDFTSIQINQSNLIKSQAIWISVASKSAWDFLLEIVYFLIILDCFKDLAHWKESLVNFIPASHLRKAYWILK